MIPTLYDPLFPYPTFFLSIQPTPPPRTRIHPDPRRLQGERMPGATAIIRPRGQCIAHSDDHLVAHHVHGDIDPAPSGRPLDPVPHRVDRKSTRLNSSH